MSILARIRSHDGDVIRQEWRFSLRRGRMSAEAIAWVQARWRDVCAEVWPLLDRWEERAAIMEFDGGLKRADAERRAYEGLASC